MSSRAYPQTKRWRQVMALALCVKHRKDKKAITHKLLETIKIALAESHQ